MKTLFIETKRLILRNLQDSDFAALHNYRNDPAVAKFQGWTDKTIPEVRHLIAEQKLLYPGKPGEWFMFAIQSKQTGELIGDCALCVNKLDPRQAELGITLAAAAQGNGYAVEAISQVLAFAFKDLSVCRVVMITCQEHVACLKLISHLPLKKLAPNMIFSGLKSAKDFFNLKENEVIFAVLKEDYC